MTAASLTLNWNQIEAYAEKMGSKSDYPTVVIGAGLGGLVCGAYLARQGVPVTIVEQHHIPGGYATAFDRAGGRFNFEVSLHGTAIHDNGAARILREIGVLDKIELVTLPEVYRLITPKLDIAVPQRDPEAYVDLLVQYFPDEATGIRGFIREMLTISKEVDTLSRNKGRFFKLLFPFQYPSMWKVRNKTLSSLLKEYVRDAELQHVMTALWGYYGLPPSRLSAFYYANATGDYLQNGSYYIKGRSQSLSDALADVIEQSGGKILYDTRVEKIRIENGTACGVLLEEGQEIQARAVVSNASVPVTLGRMLPRDAVPEDYRNALAGYKPSISSFIVWLGLNRDISRRIKSFGIHVASGRGPEVDYRSALQGGIEDQSFTVCIYDNLYAGYSNPGTSTLQLLALCGYEPWRRFEKEYAKGDKTAYHGEKKRWAEILVKRAEKNLIPGLSDMIDVMDAATPLTNWRYTGNPEGAIYGFEQSMDNAFMKRLGNRTPVKGLYFASAWGNPGGGYGGVFRGGQSAFLSLMEDWGGSS